MPSPFDAELEMLINDYGALRQHLEHDDDDRRVLQMQTRCLAAIERATGRGSVYWFQTERIINAAAGDHSRLAELIGVAESLLQNIRAGFLKTFEELIHGDVFGDYLEMSQHLLENEYKDAAAVIAGSTLEAHLKQLCTKFGVVIDIGGKPKSADTINADLVKAGAYTKLDQKSDTAWQGLRNSAAPGDYSAYDKGRVGLMISGVRDFITRIPA